MDASPGRSPQQPQSPKEQVREVLDEARQGARSALGEQQQAAAGGLDELAGALRRAGRESGDGSTIAARATDSAADALQRVSDTLRNKDLDALVRDAESFARREPLVFLGAAAVAGFLAVRFLKSSDPARQARESGDPIRQARPPEPYDAGSTPSL